jgi:bifunctional UDP-N-acetylglucosamine pyrophosphorylase/glucosamine-1-phosphate N-acetyltransferase
VLADQAVTIFAMPRKKPTAAETDASDSAPLSIVILAAGQGKRMLSDLPKVLQPLAGTPLLAHVLDLAASLEPASIHVVYGHGGDRVRQMFDNRPLKWALQSEQRGTGHAVSQAMPEIPDSHRVLVLYGDVPLLRRETLQALVQASADASLGVLTATLINPTGYGRIVRGKHGKPKRIVEDADASAKERRIREINTGVVVADARLLKRWLKALKPRNAQGEYYLTDTLARAVEEKCAIATHEAADATEVQGVNDRVQLAEVEAEYRRRRAHALMVAGVTLIDPARIDIRGTVTVGRDVQLDVNVVLEGDVVLGDRVRIGPNCVLSNLSLGADTQVFANSVLQDAKVGKNCRIGPFARIRPHSSVSDDVHLGNFVEIKASHVGVGSKINHLTYVGDSQVGSGVNIGAGTVTVNYDGVNKWPTRIGDGAFIGSGSMLVAPVTIGNGATVGAGSTIVSDVPAAKLTLARARQTTIETWQRPTKAPDKS